MTYISLIPADLPSIYLEVHRLFGVIAAVNTLIFFCYVEKPQVTEDFSVTVEFFKKENACRYMHGRCFWPDS